MRQYGDDTIHSSCDQGSVSIGGIAGSFVLLWYRTRLKNECHVLFNEYGAIERHLTVGGLRTFLSIASRRCFDNFGQRPSKPQVISDRHTRGICWSRQGFQYFFSFTVWDHAMCVQRLLRCVCHCLNIYHLTRFVLMIWLVVSSVSFWTDARFMRGGFECYQPRYHFGLIATRMAGPSPCSQQSIYELREWVAPTIKALSSLRHRYMATDRTNTRIGAR